MGVIVLRIVKKSGWSLLAVALVAATAFLQAGCHLGPEHSALSAISTPEQLADAQAKVLELNRPLMVMVIESGQGQADDDARAALQCRAVREKSGVALEAVMDLSVSRARATAARFHALETPLLICLSPRGLIVSRDQKPITSSLIVERMRKAAEQSPELDAKLRRLEEAAGKNKSDAAHLDTATVLQPFDSLSPRSGEKAGVRGADSVAVSRYAQGDTAAQLELADFLMERHNAVEAIPILTAVAHSESVETGLRIRAWAALARAHFWVAEPEKARHEAQDLIATLGAMTPEATAAANFVLGAQDATNPKRAARARQEFEAAMGAAPDSEYGKQAATALANLPKGGQ